MLHPKTSHHANFHRDWSNQLGDRGWSKKKFPHTDRHTHTQDTQHPDWLSRALQHARGATKKQSYTKQHFQLMETQLLHDSSSIVVVRFKTKKVSNKLLATLVSMAYCQPASRQPTNRHLQTGSHQNQLHPFPIHPTLNQIPVYHKSESSCPGERAMET